MGTKKDNTAFIIISVMVGMGCILVISVVGAAIVFLGPPFVPTITGPRVPMPDVPTLTYDDGLTTIDEATISIGGSSEATLETVFQAYNVYFDGQEGDTLVITAVGQAPTDPRIRLIAPDGLVVAEDDDGGGDLNSRIVVTLAQSGSYIVRVNVFTPGEVTINVEQE